MALTLFSRSRPAPVDQPVPEPWPETGETWTPDGVTVSERYYNLASSVVLVYAAEGHHRARGLHGLPPPRRQGQPAHLRHRLHAARSRTGSQRACVGLQGSAVMRAIAVSQLGMTIWGVLRVLRDDHALRRD